jgi:glycosyltransferase involved in cell wall biosynthesis
MNHELVLKAFAKLIFEDSLNAFLILRRFSIDSERYLFDLTNLIESLGIGGRVKWVGETNYENLPLLYSFSDVAVNVPIQDGLPVTIFEASACQTPVITSDLPAYQEFISKGYYKRIPSNDLSSIVIALREVLYRKNSNGSKYLEHNRQLVKDKASQEIAIRQALRIYSELTNGIVNNNVI